MLKFRSLVPFIVLLLIPLVFLSLPPTISDYIKSHLSRWTGPVIQVASSTKHYVKDSITQFWTLWKLKDENESLQRRIRVLELEVMRFEETLQENKRLSNLLHFIEKEAWTSIPARVIGRDPSAWYRGIVIDRGRTHGILPGMAVVVGDGLVGKVMESYEDWSSVMLINDARCKIGALVEKTREMGILQGEASNRCILNFLPIDAKLSVGDKVLTAGFGRYIPKGIVVGTVARVSEHEYGLYRYALVDVSADPSRVEEVLVITDRGHADASA